MSATESRVLTDDQQMDFEHAGLTRVRGAISRTDAEAMCDRIWAHLRQKYSIDRHDPSTWTVSQPHGLRSVTDAPEFDRLGSPAVRAGLDDLLGADCWEVPRRWGRLIVTYPTVDQADWEVPLGTWHNDFVPPGPDDRLRAVQTFTLLTDLQPRGGATLVLTGSHHLVGSYMSTTGEAPHPRKLRRAFGAHQWLRDLWDPEEPQSSHDRIQRYTGVGTTVDGVDLRVVELTGQAGDVYFMHCDTFHCAAPNAGSRPCMMATSAPGRTRPIPNLPAVSA